jgi:hypothetical protein
MIHAQVAVAAADGDAGATGVAGVPRGWRGWEEVSAKDRGVGVQGGGDKVRTTVGRSSQR